MGMGMGRKGKERGAGKSLRACVMCVFNVFNVHNIPITRKE